MTDEHADPYVRWLRRTTETWARATGHFANGVREANRAVFGTYGSRNGNSRSVADADGSARETPESDSGEAVRTEGPAGAESITAADLAGEDAPEWTVERVLSDRDAVAVDDSVRFSKRVDEADVLAFARASGDTNRLHLDDGFANRTRFGRRIVHGTLVSGLISAALARLPGLTIYISQDTTFLEPVDVGERLTAVVTVEEELGNDRYKLSTEVRNESERPVVEGEAVVLVDPD